MEKPLSLNRTLCAVCGQIGKGIAIGVDTVGHAMGLQPATIKKARLVGSQAGAFLAAAMGMPEAALSIASTTSVMPFNPLDLKSILDRAKQAEKAEETSDTTEV